VKNKTLEAFKEHVVLFLGKGDIQGMEHIGYGA